MNKCYMDTVREKTDLADNYGNIMNIQPLLICNQGNKQKIQKNLITNSVLLKNADVNIDEYEKIANRNYNDTIYQRNLPIGNIKNNTNLNLKIEPRPVTGGLCENKKSIRDRDMLYKINDYKYNPMADCGTNVYVPGKGPINQYFDNIDVESQLKNINEIDTKCSVQLFKVDPNGDNTSLKCFKDNFVKDYDRCESKYGYTWCDYVDGVNFEQFPKCNTVKAGCDMGEAPKKKNQAEIVVENEGQVISDVNLNRVTKELYLIRRKRELDSQINLRRNNEKLNINNQNIAQYKSNGISNIIAPTIIKQEVDEEMAKLLGERAYVEGILEKMTKESLNSSQREMYNKNNNNKNNNTKISEKCFTPILQPTIANFNCREEKTDLYRFNNLLGGENDDCYHCEKMFNNFTKRKTIVPKDSRFNYN